MLFQGSSKVIQHAAPNIVHRRGASGFSEEVHILPIAPDRTRVLLRQRFPEGTPLTKLLQLPAAHGFLTWLVQNWNYHIAFEDYPGQVWRAASSDAAGCRAKLLALASCTPPLRRHAHVQCSAA